MRILAISGSLRRDSHNTRLLRHLAEQAPAGLEIEVWDGPEVHPAVRRGRRRRSRAAGGSRAARRRSPTLTACCSPPPNTTRRSRACSRTRSTGHRVRAPRRRSRASPRRSSGRRPVASAPSGRRPSCARCSARRALGWSTSTSPSPAPTRRFSRGRADSDDHGTRARRDPRDARGRDRARLAGRARSGAPEPPPSSAARGRSPRWRRTRHRAPEKPRFATFANPSSSSRRASSRWATRSAAGRSAVSPTPTHQQSTRWPPRPDQERALFADQPRAELAALQHQAGLAQEVALAVPDEVAEQAERHGLGPGGRRGTRGDAARVADRDHLAGAAPRLQPRDRPGVAKQISAAGKVSGSIAISSTPGATKATTDPAGPRRPPPPVAAQRVARSRPRANAAARPPRGRRPSERRLSAVAIAQPPAIGRRITTSSASSGSSRTTSAVPSGCDDGGDHPQVELARETPPPPPPRRLAGLPASPSVVWPLRSSLINRPIGSSFARACSERESTLAPPAPGDAAALVRSSRWSSYEPHEIERRWQDVWAAERTWEVPEPRRSRVRRLEAEVLRARDAPLPVGRAARRSPEELLARRRDRPLPPPQRVPGPSPDGLRRVRPPGREQRDQDRRSRRARRSRPRSPPTASSSGPGACRSTGRARSPATTPRTTAGPSGSSCACSSAGSPTAPRRRCSGAR